MNVQGKLVRKMKILVHQLRYDRQCKISTSSSALHTYNNGTSMFKKEHQHQNNVAGMTLNQSCTRRYKSDIMAGNDEGDSSVVDGLSATSTWRRGQLSKISNKFNHEDEKSSPLDEEESRIDFSQPLEINSEDEVQQVWLDMENRVTRRRTISIAEAKAAGKSIGRRNVRKTDEEVWLANGVYDNSGKT
mmetsp:Transcript_19164/g.22151  ORF Transcript_19164/g.22151 Transcript_19164/m.22151 type:complete len:189 (+) Transcript_19164:184-750(+)